MSPQTAGGLDEVAPFTRVVNLKRAAPYDVYMGRAGKGHDGYFGNPHRVGEPCAMCDGKTHKRGETIPLFRAYFLERIAKDPEFHRRVLTLRGKTLGCFCRPDKGFNGKVLCHVQVIAGWLDGIPDSAVP